MRSLLRDALGATDTYLLTARDQKEKPVLPGEFEFHRAGSVEEALQLMGQYGEEGKIIAGGHSLIPLMKLRLPNRST